MQHSSNITRMLRLLANAEIKKLIKDQVFRRMNVHSPNRRTIVDVFPALEGSEAKFISRAYQIKIRLEPAVHMDRIDGNVGPVFQQRVQDNLDWNQHISFFKFYRKLAHRFNRQVNNNINILS